MTEDYISCERCGSQVYKTAKFCPNCNYRFGDSLEPNADGVEVSPAGGAEWPGRPTGSAHIGVAVVIGIVAAVLCVASVVMPDVSREFAWSDPEPNRMKYLVGAAANGLFGLAVALWAIGQIVKAISFIGRD